MSEIPEGIAADPKLWVLRIGLTHSGKLRCRKMLNKDIPLNKSKQNGHALPLADNAFLRGGDYASNS